MASSTKGYRLSAATGIVVVIALVRGFARHSAQGIGNAWVDLTRATLWVLLPLSLLLALFLHPDQLAMLRAEPELVPNAIEELMRLIPLSAGTSLAYVATEDVELSGVIVHEGDAVVASTAAANRDPAVFTDPNRLDVTRQGIVQFGFGHGSHFCLGAHLARMEMHVAITSLLVRFPKLRLAVPEEDVVWKEGSAVWGLQHLPVAF